MGKKPHPPGTAINPAPVRALNGDRTGSAHLWLFESMDEINRVMEGTNDIAQMMSNVLDAALSIFDCDRAWLLTPCDPEAGAWQIPMERTRPEYPGAYALGVELPMDPQIAETMRLLREGPGPRQFGPGQIPARVTEQFAVQSFMGMVIYPKVGESYMFGLHQCQYPRIWMPEEEQLFQAIGRRLADGLTSLLSYRELRESRLKLEQAERLARLGYWDLDLANDRIVWSDETYRIFGLKPQIPTMSIPEWAQLLHPDDREMAIRAVTRALAGGPRYDVEYRVVGPDGEIRVVHSQGDVSFDATGRPRRMFGTAQDITERKQAEEALRRSEADLQLALDAAHLGDWKWDIVTGEVIWSARCKALYGMAPDTDVNYERFLAAVHPEDRDRVDTALRRAVETRSEYSLEKRILLPDGTVRWTIGRGRVFCDDDDQPVLMTGMTMDITEYKLAEIARHETETALRESEERFRQMAESIQEVFWLTDARKQQMLYVSPAYEAIWGRSRASLYADPSGWMDTIHPEDKPAVEVALPLQVRGDYDVEYRVVRPDGTVRNIRDRAYPIRDASGTVYRLAGAAQDITAYKEQEARIQYLAYHDALTGMPNRTLIMNRLEQMLAHAQRHRQMLGVLFVDLDRFKTINDTLGHPVGDKLLRQVGACLAGVLRDEDTLGRVGGDEFLVLVSGLTTVGDAAHVTEKIHGSLSSPFKVGDHDLHVTASIGISVFPRDGDGAETLVKYADTALHLAKEQGRNTFRFFSPELDARVRMRLQLENDLRRAVERNELLVHYQPQLNPVSGALTGVEALVRWQHPVQGLVSPDDFIPIADETGLIIPIGEWVLRAASDQARAWHAAGVRDFRVSVNISGRQLDQTDFAATVRRILAETGCDPGLLEFEITESSVIKEPEESVVKLRALHEVGIQLAMDDFGTGYSSLAYLKRFPLDRLKIDRSFVAGIPDDGDDVAIVQAIIVLARQLRLKVVAEGVETEAQRNFLKANGCDDIQGYLISKPLAARDLERKFNLPNPHA